MLFPMTKSGGGTTLTHHSITVAKTSSTTAYTNSVTVQGKIIFAITNTYYNGYFITVGGDETVDGVFGYGTYEYLNNIPAFVQNGNSATFNVGASQTFQTVYVDYWSED